MVLIELVLFACVIAVIDNWPDSSARNVADAPRIPDDLLSKLRKRLPMTQILRHQQCWQKLRAVDVLKA